MSAATPDSPRRIALVAFMLAAVVPLALCASRLNHDLWTDEVYTLTMFASRPVTEIARDYSAPNNHVFYSIALHMWLRLVEPLANAEFVLRLPGLALACAALAGTFAFGRCWRGLPAAVAGAVMLGLTQMFLGHAMQLRGYGLSTALAAWLAVFALPEHDGGLRRIAAIVLLGAAALYTLPTNILWLAPLTLLAVGGQAAMRRGGRRVAVEALAWLAVWCLAALLYLPIYRDVLAASGAAPADRWGAAARLATTFGDVALRDAWPLVVLAVGGAFIVLRQCNLRWGAAIIAGTLGGAMILSGALGISPFVRNLCPLLPLLCAGVGAMASEFVSALLRVVERRRKAACPTAIHAAWSGAIVAVVLLPAVKNYPTRLEVQRLHHFAQDGYFNYYDANFHPARLAATLRDTAVAEEGYLLLVPEADHFTLSYYLAQYAQPQRKPPPAGSPAAIRLYAALAPQTDIKELLAQWQLPPEIATEMSTVANVGYYRLVRWPRLWPLANWPPATENRATDLPRDGDPRLPTLP